MHEVTSSGQMSKPTLQDCQEGEIVVWEDRLFRVMRLLDCKTMGISLDGEGTISGVPLVTKLSPGTVITIVVGGETPAESRFPVVGHIGRGEKDGPKPQTDAEFLESLRERNVHFGIGGGQPGCGTFFWASHGFSEHCQKNTFAKAVQWLREQVDG